MAVQDLGSLADYVLNGDNYERVQPDGSVLVIPGRPQGLLIPQRATDLYERIAKVQASTDPFIPDCPGSECVLFVHDIFTGLYRDVASSSFGPGSTTPFCACGLTSGPPYNNGDEQLDEAKCKRDLLAYVESLVGQPGINFFPQWIYDELGIPPGALFAPDFFFIGCYGDLIVIPGCAPCAPGETLDPLTCGCSIFAKPPPPCCVSYSPGCCVRGATA